MTWDNVPDDWCSHYDTCADCGARYHASEGCACVECDGCGESIHEDDIHDHAGKALCEGCAEDELDLERTLDPAGGDEEVSCGAE